MCVCVCVGEYTELDIDCELFGMEMLVVKGSIWNIV